MIRHAIDQELSSGDGVEQRIAATLDRIQGRFVTMQRAQQTLFAFVDTSRQGVADRFTRSSRLLRWPRERAL